MAAGQAVSGDAGRGQRFSEAQGGHTHPWGQRETCSELRNGPQGSVGRGTGLTVPWGALSSRAHPRVHRFVLQAYYVPGTGDAAGRRRENPCPPPQSSWQAVV